MKDLIKKGGVIEFKIGQQSKKKKGGGSSGKWQFENGGVPGSALPGIDRV